MQLLLFDHRFCAHLFGDVFVGRHPAAVLHRDAGDPMDVPFLRFDGENFGDLAGAIAQQFAAVVLDVLRETALRLARLQDLAQGPARFDKIG